MDMPSTGGSGQRFGRGAGSGSGGSGFSGFNLGSLGSLGDLRNIDLGKLDLKNLNLGEALEGLREQFDQRAGEFGLGGCGVRGGRAGGARGGRRGARADHEDVRGAILTLLAEAPLHGSDLIREIGERSEGAWEPTPGTVYPTLQLLVDEGLLSVDEADGKRRYSLTESGTAEAAGVTGLPWQADADGDDEHDDESDHGHYGPRAALPRAGIRLGRAARQLAIDGTPEQQEQAVEILNEARRKLYAILAEA